MGIEAGLLGWLLATVGLGLAAFWRRELGRRRELVARACHELRGPMTAARLALASMGRRREAPEDRLAGLDLELRRAGRALDDLAAARSGRRLIDRDEPVAVDELLEDQHASWGVVAGAYGCRVLLGGAPRGAVVQGDRVRLAQALGNLVANSVEHGGGTIELSARRVGRRHVRLEVIDQGPGLPAPVGELTRGARGGRGSRGRGLAIAAEIAHRHGGRIAAAPAEHGARVGIELPVRQAS
jgi:signal transduction histidine kinase